MHLYDNIKYIQSFIIIQDITTIFAMIKAENTKHNKIDLLFNSLYEKVKIELFVKNIVIFVYFIHKIIEIC